MLLLIVCVILAATGLVSLFWRRERVSKSASAEITIAPESLLYSVHSVNLIALENSLRWLAHCGRQSRDELWSNRYRVELRFVRQLLRDMLLNACHIQRVGVSDSGEIFLQCMKEGERCIFTARRLDFLIAVLERFPLLAFALCREDEGMITALTNTVLERYRKAVWALLAWGHIQEAWIADSLESVLLGRGFFPEDELPNNVIPMPIRSH